MILFTIAVLEFHYACFIDYVLVKLCLFRLVFDCFLWFLGGYCWDLVVYLLVYVWLLVIVFT